MKITDITESLNYQTDINWNDNDIGTFSINENNFKVEVRPATKKEQSTFTPFFTSPPSVGNVDFSLILPSGRTTQDLTGTSGSTAMKVFSVVAQAVSEQIKKHKYDIILCVAKQTSSPTNYQNRVEAYETIVERAARKAGMQPMVLLNRPTETIYVVYNFKFDDEIQKVKQHLQQYYKT